jgi:hypothetical protein
MELKFVTRENDYLVFETQQGDRLRTLIDDGLRDAIRKEQASASSGVSPKDVQSGLRAGKSLSEVAAELGVPERAIEPFAAPILDELRYILDAALNTTLPSGNKMVRFEELVADSFPSAELRVYKNQDRWLVEDANQADLNWFFDVKSRHLEPIGDSAKNLGKSSQNKNEVISSTQLRSVGGAAQAGIQPAAPAPEVAKPSESELPNQGASIHDLVQQLRERKPEQNRPASAKGRAALPSWDDIVLGTSNLDQGSNANPDQRDS